MERSHGMYKIYEHGIDIILEEYKMEMIDRYEIYEHGIDIISRRIIRGIIDRHERYVS